MYIEDKLNYRLETIHFEQMDKRTKWQVIQYFREHKNKLFIKVYV
jgi:hypothetical protein